MKLSTWHRIALLFAGLVAAVAFLGWKCRHDPKFNYLPQDRQAEWILFPSVFHAAAHPVVSIDATFRRDVALDTRPAKADLKVRGAKRVELKINGSPVPLSPAANWKQISSVEISGFLKAGTNRLEARVFNENAPPALWLCLHADNVALRSDTSWEVSLADSAWRRAALASVPRLPGPGNSVSGGEKIVRVWPKIYPAEVVIFVVALVIYAAASFCFRRFQAPAGGLSRKQALLVFFSLASLWILLFCNNAVRLPFHAGFDSGDHLQYVTYIQDHGRLPLATEGYEMFQPPLYYALSAGALATAHVSATAPSGVMLLRLLTTLFGIALFGFVFLTLRLLFPRQAGLQMVGVTVAALLPMQLYLSHYVTNETLAATLITASVYLALRLARQEHPSPWQYLWLGACLGAALLTKATALLLLAPLLLMLIPKSLSASGARNLAVMLAAIFVVCGWHYLRVWYHFGTPLLGNWDMAAGFPLWQDPGYHVASDYLRFGRALVQPLFASLNGFADGIYCTAWGDGLIGGVTGLTLRPPWNYGLMLTGYLFAVVPTLLIISGFLGISWRFVRAPGREDFLLLAFAAVTLLGIIYMTLKIASYAQVKAFYGLSALVPICFFSAVGFELLARRGKAVRHIVAIVFLAWATNSFASFWIQPSSEQKTYVARRLRAAGQNDAAAVEAKNALATDPSNPRARWLLASITAELGQTEEAIRQTERTLEISPFDAASHLQLATVLAKQTTDDRRALIEARRAVELGPEEPAAYNVLLFSLLRAKENDQVIDVARDALTVSPFNAELHYTLALAVARRGDFTGATTHFGYVLLIAPQWKEPREKLRLALSVLGSDPQKAEHLREAISAAPDSPPLLNEFAWILATNPDPSLRNGEEALRLARRACTVSGSKDPRLLRTLAAAYAEAGKFREATQTAEQAVSLARASGDTTTADAIQRLQAWFRANQPYREEMKP